MKKSKLLPMMLSLVAMALAGCGETPASSSVAPTSSVAPAASSVAPASSQAETSVASEASGAEESAAEEDTHNYLFEAEDTDLTDKQGLGYSGSATEAELVAYCKTCEASNDRYLTYLYKSGLSIDFVVEATEDVKNVKLSMRLSCEMKDITLTSDLYKVKVTTPDNSTRAYTYDDIKLKWSGDKGVPANFQDFLVSSKVSLQKGTNIISLVADNSVSLGGTTGATAPMLDCIKLVTPDTSVSILSMEKTEGNY